MDQGRRRSTADVVRQGLPLAPAAHTGNPRRPSATSPAPRRSSCPTPPHLAAAGLAGGSPPARRTIRRARRAAPPSAQKATAAAIQPPNRPSAAQPEVLTPTAHRAGGRPAPTADRRLRRKLTAPVRAGVRPRSRRDEWRAAPGLRRSDRAWRAVLGVTGRRRDRGPRALGARTQRCPSSAVWYWPDRSGRSGVRTPTSPIRR